MLSLTWWHPLESGETAARAREAALELAVRALARRDLSRRALELRLQKAGIPPELSAATVAELAEERLLDDRRLAQTRAASLVARGLGDAAIDARLTADGIDADVRHETIAELAPEEDRARALAAGLAGRGPARMAAALDRRGFGSGAVEAALAALDGDSSAELR